MLEDTAAAGAASHRAACSSGCQSTAAELDLHRRRIDRRRQARRRELPRHRQRGRPGVRPLHLRLDRPAKGVAMPHGALSTMLAWQRTTSGSSPPARTLQFAVAQLRRRVPGALLDLVVRRRRSSWSTRRRGAIPSRCSPCYGAERRAAVRALRRAATAGRGGARAWDRPDSAREVITAGEALQVDTCDPRVLRAPAGVHPRTTSTARPRATSSRPSRSTVRREGWPDRPPIGRPIANARIYVLDQPRAPGAGRRAGRAAHRRRASWRAATSAART